MRNMSFSMTKDQVRQKRKLVTRRVGWKFLKRGDLVQPVEKAQGLKKGEKVKKIGTPIRILSVREERLDTINAVDCRLEGFPHLKPTEFVEMFCQGHAIKLDDGKTRKCRPEDNVTRIAFEYTN